MIDNALVLAGILALGCAAYLRIDAWRRKAAGARLVKRVMQ